jgi:hypothetical protein
MHTNMHRTHILKHTCKHVSMCVCVCVCICIYMYVCVYMEYINIWRSRCLILEKETVCLLVYGVYYSSRIDIYIYIHIYIHIYIYIYIYSSCIRRVL